MLGRSRFHRLSGPGLALALALGLGLPAVQPGVAPTTVPRAAAAAAGTALLRPVTTLHSNGAELSWDRYVPAVGETFTSYQVHRSATATFTPSASTLLTTISDIDVTSYVDTTAKPSTAFSYKLVANAAVSNEVRVTLPPTGTSTATLQPAGTDGQATYVVHDVSTPAACSDGRNYGAATTIGIGPDATGWQRRGLLRFDLRDIPASATVSSAVLTMSFAATTNPNLAVSVHRVKQPWTEGTESATCNSSGVTWLETQRAVKWKTGGGAIDGTADASLVAKSRAAAGTDSFTLTSLVREWVGGAAANHGLMIRGTGAADTPGTTSPNFSYYSDDYGTAGKRPKLVVSWSDGSGPVVPRVSLASPTGGAQVGGAVPLTATAGDDRRVDKVEFLVDGAVVATDAAAPWAATWTSTAATAGAHTITARATDDAGNVKTSAARTVTVDNSAAPTVTLAAPTTSTGVIALSATATDDVGVTSVEFYVDDARIATDTTSPYTASWNTLDVTNPAYDGSHTITAKAYDAGGKATTSTARTVTTTNTSGTEYQATLELREPGTTTPLAIPDSVMDNEKTSSTDSYSGSTSTRSLDSSPKSSTLSYATYSGLTAYSYAESNSSLGAPAGAAPADNAGATTSSKSASSAAPSESGAICCGTTFYYTTWGGGLIPPTPRDPESVSTQAVNADVLVTNTSAVAWKGGSSGLQLWYRWYVPTEVPKGDGSVGDKGVVLFEGPASSYFPSTVQAGASKTVPVVLEPPTLPTGIDKAQVRLRIDLYDIDSTSSVRWFAAKGNKPVDQPVVVNRDLEGALGLERFWQYDGDETGAGSSTVTNVANGNVVWRWSPFFTPGRGVPTMLDITYNSLEDHSESPAGNNFSLSISGLTRWGYGLDIHPNRADQISGRGNKYVAFTDGDGTTHEFTGTTKADGTTRWTEPAGVNLYLRSTGSTDDARHWALTKPDGTTFYFDGDGYPRSVEDRNGNVLTFTLVDTPPGEDPGGPKKRITAVTDAAGRSYTVDYYSKSEVKRAHVRGRIESIKDHSGSELHFDYYDDGNLLRLTQRGGTKANGETLADRSFVFTYTTSNGAGPAIPLATDRVDPEARTPNQSTRLYSIRDPRGAETNFAYYGPGSGQLRWKLQSRWNRLGDPTTACTGANSCTSFSYDITNRRTTVDAPQSRDTEYVYDTDGKVTTIVNPLEQTTSVVWSPDFKVTKVTEPGGAVRTWGYNHNGYLTDQTDAMGNRTTLTYLNRSLDADDTLGHWSLLRTKTSARGTATSTAGDFTWTYAYDGAAGADGNVTSVTDPEDFVTTYTWNLRGSTSPGTVSSATDPNGGTTTFEYDPSGQPKKITDAVGSVTQMGYDVDGLLRWVQDPRHSSEPNPTLAGEAGDRVAASFLDYDSFHRLGRQSAPKSTDLDRGNLVWSSAEYDADDNVVRRVDPHYGTAAGDPENGEVSSLAWDAMDQPLSTTDQEGDTRAYAWDTAGRLVQSTRPKGVETAADAVDFSSQYDYDALDRVVTQRDHGTSSSDVRATHMCYDVPGDLRSVTSPRAGLTAPSCPGNGPSAAAFTKTYSYDAAHRQLTSTDPLGHQERTSYDADNNVVSRVKDIDKAAAPGRVTSTTVAYDERDLPIRTTQRFTSARDLVTVVKYDGNGNKILQASPRATDQANGAAVDQSSPYVTAYSYDAVNQLVRITLPFGPAETERQYVHRSYDKNGNLAWTSFPVTTSDPAQVQDTARTTMTYWDPGWIRTSKNPTDPRVTFDYAAQSWQTSRTPDKKGQPGVPDSERQMLWRYWPDGQLRERRDRDGNPSRYTYDADNNMVTGLDASGVQGADDAPMETEATWTGFDEVEKVSHRRKNDATPNPWQFSTYEYDANGNVVHRLENAEENASRTAITKGADEQALAYDQADWLKEQVDLNQTQAVAGLPSGTECKDDQRVVNAFTDTGWEQRREVYRAGATCTSDKTTWPLKTATTWTHFDNGKLKTLRTTNNSGALLTSHDVEYDVSVTASGGAAVNRYEDGNRTKDTYVLKRADAKTTCTDAANPCVATYTYDARGRLTTNQRRVDPVTGPVVDRYTLDEPAQLIGDKTIRGGNVTTRDTAEDPPVTQRYDSNQLKELTSNGATASYVYDNYGNVDCVTNVAGSTSCPTSGLVTDYAYDSLNRLASQKTYSGGSTVTDSAEYTYDALDRVTKEVEAHAGTGDDRTTNFSHQGLSNLVTEEKQSGGTNPKTKTFAYDSYGHRISMSSTVNGTTQTDTFTYSYDVHGSVSQLISDTGTVTSSYGYDAYGGEDAGLSSTQDASDTDLNPLNPYRFQGRRLDSGSATSTSEATSVDMGARRFGTDTGRFLQEDMYGGALADLGLSLDPLAQNRYSLAGGNPVSFVEIDGHMYIADGGGGGSPSPNPTPTPTPTPTPDPTPSSTPTTPPPPTISPVRPGTELTTPTDWGQVAKDVNSSFAWGTGAVAGGWALRDLAEEGGRGLRAGSSEAGRYLSKLSRDPVARNVGRAFNTPVLKAAGKAAPFVGAGLSIWQNATEEGNSTSDVIVESGVEIGVGLAAGVAIGAACAATGGIGCLVAGAAIAIGSSYIGEQLGEVASDTVDAIGEGIGDAADAVGDAIGGLF